MIHSLKWLLKVLAWVFGVATLAISIAFLLFTFLVLPRLDHYRGALEHQLSQIVGRQVSIGRLSGQWDGVAPLLELSRLSIANPSGAALTLDRVEVKPSWLSVLSLSPRMALIALKGPSIDLRRGRDGLFYLNGFATNSSGGQGNLGNLLLRQTLISVTDARISWQDEYLGLPRLVLDHGQLELGNGLFGHTIKLSGRPPATVGNSIEVAGRWHGDDTRDWANWSGTLSSQLNGARINAWSKYLQSFGLLRTGEGDGSIDLSFSDGHINSLQADVRLRNAAYTLPGAGELTVPILGGQLSLERGLNGYQVDATHLTLLSASGPVFDNSSIRGVWNSGADGGGNLSVDNVNLAPLGPFLHAFGIDRNPLFEHFSPTGQLNNLTLTWKGVIESPSQYRIESAFRQLAWKPFGAVPGVEGVDGRANFDQSGGRLVLTQARVINMPHVFPKPLTFSSLAADIVWTSSRQGMTVDFKQMKFANRDLSGWLSGSYRYHGVGAGQVDLKAGISPVAATRVVDYLPYQAGSDTLHWLSAALRSGSLENTTMTLSGDLDRFPFKDGNGGEFLVGGDVRRGVLSYGKAWPTIDDISARLQFHNQRMDIESSRASTLGVPLSAVKVVIPDLSAPQVMLLVNGQAAGDLPDMLRFTGKSPVDGWLSGFTSTIRAKGAAQLKLGLLIPLSGPSPIRVNGVVHFTGNQVELSSLPLPPLEAVTGDFGFTERGVVSQGVRFKAFGGDFVLTADTDSAARMRFAVDGQADSAKVAAAYVSALAPYLSGVSHYHARFALRNGLESLQVGSDLIGTDLSAPAPLAKASTAALPLNLTLLPAARSSDAGLRLNFSLGSQAAGRARLGGRGELQALEVTIGRSLGALPSEGLLIKLAVPKLDLESWYDWSKRASAPASPGLPLALELATPDLYWGSYHLSNASVHIGHMPQDSNWHAEIDAAQLKGELDYSSQGRGMIQARLPLLVVDLPAMRSLAGPELARQQVQSLPAMDAHIGNLVYQGHSLGKLEMHASYVNQDWLLDPVRLTMPEGSLNATVRVLGAGSVQSRFSVEASDVGKMLERVGSMDTFRKGEGKVTGELSWPGRLEDFDFARASGVADMDLSNGRFAQIHPGVARLLGVLSLQSLSRRIHLDFTDVFSDGFAFDTLKGSASINQGIFKSDNVLMKGPAAEVHIQGLVNLAAETQQLQVHVEPHLAESVALVTGAALINPVIGVAALAAQKVLQDPVGRIFSVDYLVSGTLSDPIVTKVSPLKSQPMRKVRP